MFEVVGLDAHAVDTAEDRGAFGVNFRVRARAVRLLAPRSAVARSVAVHDLCALGAGHAGARGHAPAAPGAAVRARARQGARSTRARTAIRHRPGRVRSTLTLTAASRPIAPRAPSTVGVARPRARRLTAVAARFLFHAVGVGPASRRRRCATSEQSTGTTRGHDNAATGFTARATTGRTNIAAGSAFSDTAWRARRGHPRHAGRTRVAGAAVEQVVIVRTAAQCRKNERYRQMSEAKLRFRTTRLLTHDR
jgi:hypothetical protein